MEIFIIKNKMLTVVQGCVSSKNKKEENEEGEKIKKYKPDKVLEHERDLYVKSSETKRRLDLGFKFSKLPSGLEFKTLSGLEVNKLRNYKKIDGEKNLEKLPENIEEKEEEVLTEENIN